MLIKQYGQDESPERAYSPALARRKLTWTETRIWTWCRPPTRNDTIWTSDRRYTRLTNPFSKTAKMLAYSIAISVFYHNFVRVNQTLKTTPAVKAGLADRKWKIEEMVDLMPLTLAGKRGSYKKRISN